MNLKKYFLKIFIFLSAFFLIESNYKLRNSIKAEPLNKNSSNSSLLENNLKNKNNIISLNFNQFKLSLEEKLNNLEKNSFFYLLANNKNKDDLFEVDIESDIQYEQNNIAYAEGNVVINFSDAEILADKAYYDKKKKHFFVEGNVVFNKGNQYFEASTFFYDFSKENGYVNNVYGVLDLINFN